MTYLTESGRKALLEYHYVGSDSSYLSKLMNPYWEFVAALMPKWLAPNTITLIGTIGIVFAFILQVIVYCESNLFGVSPPYVYILCAFLLFAYQTLDSVDGKHARNIKASSPVGEMFDHGCDAIVTVLLACTTLSIMQAGSGWWTFATFIVLNTTSVLTLWEDYITDVLRFGAFNSPTEAILINIGIMLATARFGTDFWVHNVTEFVNLSHIFPLIKFNHAILVIGTIMGISVILSSINYVLAESKKPHNRRGGFDGAVAALNPYIITTISFIVWALTSNLLYDNILLFCFAYGVTTAYLQTRFIFARVCNEHAPNFYYLIMPLPLCALYSVVAYFLPVFNQVYSQTVSLYFFMAWATVCYLHFAIVAIKECCAVLNVRVFHVKQKDQ